MNDKRGSLWRKWDLHVHTPESLVHHFKATGEDDIWESYIKDLEKLPSEFKVLGINDYVFLDGYKEILKYKQRGRLPNIDLILPVIEFRIRRFAGHKQFKRINFHVIFSDEITPDIIQNQFLNGLTANYQLSPGINNTVRWSGLISKDSLVDLGRQIKATVPTAELVNYGSDLEEGFNNLNLDEGDIIKLLSASSYFKEKLSFLILPMKTDLAKIH